MGFFISAASIGWLNPLCEEKVVCVAAASWSRIRLEWCMAGSVRSGLVPPPPAVYIHTRILGVICALVFLGVGSALEFWVWYKDRGCIFTF